jgi:hypothetical protein
MESKTPTIDAIGADRAEEMLSWLRDFYTDFDRAIILTCGMPEWFQSYIGSEGFVKMDSTVRRESAEVYTNIISGCGMLADFGSEISKALRSLQSKKGGWK